jgi:hypothetical protein
MTINLKETVTAAIAAGTATAASDPNSNVTHSDVPGVIAAASAAAAPAVQEAQSRIDYITNNESPFQSWGNAAGVTGTITALYGIVIALHDGFQPVEDQTLMITGIGAGVSAALWFVGRFRGKPIGE